MNRVALVTGGTRGIGESISVALRDAGYRVAACYGGNEERARAFAERTGISVWKFDVSDYTACAEGVGAIVRYVGPVDVLINNAGITRDAVLHRMAPEQWSAVLATNLTSIFNLSRLVIGGMRERGFGRIVSVSSINGQAGQFGQTNYSAAKAGVIGFTKALALESAAKGITVNAVCPGYIDTDMVRTVPPEVLDRIVQRIPVGRLGQAAEVARAVLFLAAEEAGFITGTTLSLNGGQHMH